MSGACGPGHLGGCHGLTGVLAQPAMSIAGAAGAMLAASTANSLLTRQGFFALASPSTAPKFAAPRHPNVIGASISHPSIADSCMGFAQIGSRFRKHVLILDPNLPQCVCRIGMHSVCFIPYVEDHVDPCSSTSNHTLPHIIYMHCVHYS